MKKLPILLPYAFHRIPASFVSAVVVLVLMSSCKHTTSPTNTGSFAGRIVLFDSTATMLSDFSGTTVRIDGTTFSTTTDSIGQWQITDVPEGQYNITASKPEFGAFHWYEQQMLDRRLDLSTAALANMPNETPVLASAGWGPFEALNAEGQTDGYFQGLEEYFDLDSTVQPSDPHLATGSGTGQGIFMDDLRAAGAKSGQTIYVSISTAFSGADYGEHFAWSYFDPVHNETRYASTGPKSNVIAVTMP